MTLKTAGVLMLAPFSFTTLAAPQDIDLDDCETAPPVHVFPATTGKPITTNITVLNNGGGRLYFDFNTTPQSNAGVACSGASPKFACNGVAIELPGPAEEPVDPDARVKVAGTPTAVGVFSFKLIASPEDGSKDSCVREYHLEIKEPIGPRPPENLNAQ